MVRRDVLTAVLLNCLLTAAAFLGCERSPLPAVVQASERSPSPAVVQARAAVTVAQADVDAARRELEQAEAEERAANAAVAQADQEPGLIRVRRAMEEARRRSAEHNDGNALHPTHEWAMEGVGLGGEFVRAQNAVGRAEGPLRSAQARATQATFDVGRLQASLRRKEADLARGRQVLDATEAAAR